MASTPSAPPDFKNSTINMIADIFWPSTENAKRWSKGNISEFTQSSKSHSMSSLANRVTVHVRTDGGEANFSACSCCEAPGDMGKRLCYLALAIMLIIGIIVVAAFLLL